MNDLINDDRTLTDKLYNVAVFLIFASIGFSVLFGMVYAHAVLLQSLTKSLTTVLGG